MRSQVDFAGAQAGDDTVDVDLTEIHDVAIADERGSDETVQCRPAFAIYAEALSPYSPNRVEEITGVLAKDISHAAEMLGPGQRISHYAWSGVGQHTNATQTARAMATLYALTGSFDRKGANWRFTTLPTNKVEDYVALVPQQQRAKTLGLTERPLGPAAKGTINIAICARRFLKRSRIKSAA